MCIELLLCGLGSIEVEMCINSDGFLFVVVCVENDVVLFVLCEERDFLVVIIGENVFGFLDF